MYNICGFTHVQNIHQCEPWVPVAAPWARVRGIPVYGPTNGTPADTTPRGRFWAADNERVRNVDPHT